MCYIAYSTQTLRGVYPPKTLEEDPPAAGPSPPYFLLPIPPLLSFSPPLFRGRNPLTPSHHLLFPSLPL